MCVQDYNIAQGMQLIRKSFQCTANTPHLIMPASKSRVGYAIFYPNTGGELYYGSSGVGYSLGRISSAMSKIDGLWMLNSDGPLVQMDIYVELNATTQFNWIEYHLPLDRQERLRFAEGLNNK